MTTNPALADAPIRSTADLTARWSSVLGPPVFAARSLWLMWLDGDGRMLPVVIPVDDVPLVPDRILVAGLLSLHEAVTEEHLGGDGHLALALCRPGRPETTGDDEVWAAELRLALDDGVEGWSLHVAAAGAVAPLVVPPETAWARS
jgi:hypothetical protein